MRPLTKANLLSGSAALFENLEERMMMYTPWGNWPTFLGMDKVFTNYPWLNGGGNGVAVVDKGIDYWHPALGGNRATGTKSPRIVNVYDWRDNDTDPFPSESELVDASNAHATGVAGILAAYPYNYNGRHYQGILQNSVLYNLRTNRLNSQWTIKYALQWVLANYQKYHITAINLTDFVGTNATTPVYDAEVKALYNAGIFIATPVANEWMNPTAPKAPIGYPAKSPYIFGTGGILPDGTINPKTQRGPGLDLLGPSYAVSLPYYVANDGTQVDKDIYTDYGQGNSWGTPHTVGTAVLIQQIDPTIKPDEIMKILQDSGQPVVDPDGTGTYKRLDMYAAINLAYYRRDDILDQTGRGNDDMAHASPITLNSSGAGSLSNLKLLIGDPDWYTFNITAPEDYKISLGYNGSSYWPDAQLMDNTGTVIGTVGQAGLVKRLSPGQYYLKVSSMTQSLIGTYSVFIGDPPITPGLPGQNGGYNALKYDRSNNLDFAWFDNVTKRLNFAQRTAAGVWSDSTIVDSNADTGEMLSMALDSHGNPGIAYNDGPNADLKYAHFNGTSWDIETVDSNYRTGYYPSIQFDYSDRPVIAYYYRTSGDLRMAAKGSSGWTITTIDTKGDVGRYPSLALNPKTSRWAIAYESTSTGQFKYAEQTKSGWSVVTADSSTRGGGGYVSLAFNNVGLPAFSYYDAYNANLKYDRFDGTRWIPTTLAAKGSVGLYTNLFFDPGNSYLPVVYYFNKSSNSVMAARNSGSAWDFELLASAGGRELHVCLDNQNYETFSYLDTGTNTIKIAAPV